MIPNQINTIQLNLATHFIYQDTQFDGIKATIGEVQDIMNNTVLKLHDLAISLDVTLQALATNPDVTEAVSKEVNYQNVTIDTNDTEQMITVLTKAFKIYDLSQNYGEAFFAFSFVHSTSLLDITTLKSALVTYYTSVQISAYILKEKFSPKLQAKIARIFKTYVIQNEVYYHEMGLHSLCYWKHSGFITTTRKFITSLTMG